MRAWIPWLALACGSRSEPTPAPAPAPSGRPAAAPPRTPITPLALGVGARYLLGGDGPRLGAEPRWVAFSGDGARLAAIDRDGRVIVWDADTGKPIERAEGGGYRSFLGFEGTQLRFKPPPGFEDARIAQDGRWLGAAIAGRFELHEIDTGRRAAAPLGELEELVVAGDTIAILGADRAVRAGALGGPAPIVVPAAEDTVWLRLAPDGKRLATVARNGVIRIRPLPSGELVEVKLDKLVDDSTGATALAWSHDGETLAVAIAGQIVALIQTRDGASTELAREPFGNGLVDLAFAPDDRRIAAATKYGRIRLWDVTTAAPVHRHTGHIATVWGVAISDDGKAIASAGDEQVRVWRPDAQPDPAEYDDFDTSVVDVAVSADGSLVASCARGEIVVRRVPSGALVSKLDNHHLDCEGIAFGGNRLVYVGTGTRLDGFAVETGALQHTFALAAGRKYGSSELAVSRDGTLLATGGDDGKLAVHALPHGELRWVVEMPKDPHEDKERLRVDGLAFDSTGKQLAAIVESVGVRVYDVRTGKPTRTLDAHPRAVAFAGSRIVVGGNDGELRAFDPRGGSVVLGRHPIGGIESLAATASRVVAGGEDGSLSVWDVK